MATIPSVIRCPASLAVYKPGVPIEAETTPENVLVLLRNHRLGPGAQRGDMEPMFRFAFDGNFDTEQEARDWARDVWPEMRELSVAVVSVG